jgi:hypothetical protein
MYKNILKVSYMTKAIAIIIVFCLVTVMLAQESQMSYSSHDGAVAFEYPESWDLETQQFTFNSRYAYVLWNPPRNPMNLYFDSEERSRIILEFLKDTPDDNLVNPVDYAAYVLEDDYSVIEETEINGYPAVLVEIGDVDDAQYGILYSIVRDDGWVVIASLGTPVENQDASVDDFEQFIDSVEFDSELAEIPFVRDTPDYDYSDVELTQSHTNQQGLLSVDYPTDWELTSSEPYYSGPPLGYVVRFELPEDEMSAFIFVFDTTTDRLGLPLNQNTSYEYMYHRRNLTGVELSEYRIGEFDAVLVEADEENSLSLYFDANEIWIAQGSITGGTDEARHAYESELIAIMASLEFGLQQSFVSAPLFYVDFSDEWVYAVNNQDSSNYAQYILRPAGSVNPAGPRIVIEFIYIESSDKVLLEDIPGLIEVEAINSEWLTIGDNEIYRFEARQSESPQFGRWSAFYVGEEWLMIVQSLANIETQFEATLDIAESIIENVEFTLDAE